MFISNSSICQKYSNTRRNCKKKKKLLYVFLRLRMWVRRGWKVERKYVAPQTGDIWSSKFLSETSQWRLNVVRYRHDDIFMFGISKILLHCPFQTWQILTPSSSHHRLCAQRDYLRELCAVAVEHTTLRTKVDVISQLTGLCAATIQTITASHFGVRVLSHMTIIYKQSAEKMFFIIFRINIKSEIGNLNIFWTDISPIGRRWEIFKCQLSAADNDREY